MRRGSLSSLLVFVALFRRSGHWLAQNSAFLIKDAATGDALRSQLVLLPEDLNVAHPEPPEHEARRP